MGIELDPRPLIAFQGKGPRCWAGATTSWLTVNLNRPQLNLEQLVERYGNPQKGGSINFQDAKWKQLTDDMQWKKMDAIVLNTDNALTSFLGIEIWLKKFGYLIFIINQSKGLSHAVVVFGIRTLPNLGAVLHVMDPAVGDYVFLRFDSLFDKGVVIIHTVELIGPARRPRPTFTTLPDGPPVNP